MRSKISQRILDETPENLKENVRRYADALVKNNGKNICKNCTCEDLEDWIGCQDNNNK